MALNKSFSILFFNRNTHLSHKLFTKTIIEIENENPNLKSGKEKKNVFLLFHFGNKICKLDEIIIFPIVDQCNSDFHADTLLVENPNWIITST